MLRLVFLAILLSLGVQVNLAAAQTADQRPTAASQVPARDAGRIKGVVTYYFNDNFGDKGDVGSTAFLLAGSVQLPPADTEVQLSKEMVSISYRLSRNEVKQNKDAAKNKMPLPNPPRVVSVPVLDHTTVDVNGAFQFDDVPPGTYTVVIQSSHTKEASFVSSRDSDGRLAFVETDVKPGRAADASYKFPATGI